MVLITSVKITPVLRGSYLMQGPVDEADHDIEKNMVSPQPETELGKCSMSKKVHMRGESGTCNLCSAPCSSCMHLNRALMGSRTEEFSDESCRVNAVSQYSVNESGTLSSLKSRASDNLQHTTSETSNLHSVNSSHDSFSENADSKSTLRSTIISDALDVEMLTKLASGGTIAEDQLSSKPQCGLDQRTFSNKYVEIKEEGHDDNISCVRPNDATVVVSNHNRNINSSTASVSSLALEGSWKVTQFNKLGSSEIPSSKDADASSRSLNEQSPYTDSHNAKSLSYNTNLTDLEENPSSHIQNKVPECSMDHINSSLTKEVASEIASVRKSVSCKAHIGGSSEVSMKSYTKSEAEANKDSGDRTDEELKSSDQDEHNDKSKELVESSDMQEPPLQSGSGDESDESDIVEEDVKVCDICGDAGREEKLAICSRCSDGAEHTYCMREMLQKVPEGDWLCEECKFAEESENQKQGSEVEGKRTNKISSSTHVSAKRHAENVEVASAKRQELETGTESPKPLSPSRIVTGSPRPSSPSRIVALSRDSSFKSLDKGKVKSAQHNDILETARFPTIGPRLQTPKGTLLKSNSFSTVNSKSKVKLVDEVVPQKQKGAREYTSIDTKEGAARIMSKSMSFKYANSGRSNATESKVRMLSPKFNHVQDPKGLKQTKERGTFERKNLSKLDRPLVSSTTANATVSTPKVDQKLASRGETSLPSFVSNNRESKVVQSDGKSSLSKVTSSLGRKGVEVPVTSGSTEAKISSLCLPNAVGASSTSGMFSSAEQKLNKISPKDEPPSSYSLNAERPSNTVDGTVQDGLPMTNHYEKTRESSSIRPRPTATSASKTVFCQKCKDIGHATEFCTNGTPQAPGIDVSVARSSREEMHEGNKLKAAINAALLRRPEIYRKKRVLDQPDESSLSSTDLNYEISPQDQLLASNKSKNIMSTEGSCERQAIGSSALDSYKHTTVNNSKQFSLQPTDVFSSKVGDSDSTVVSVGKPTIREFPSQASTTTSVLLKTSAIPEYDFIWHGVFEVNKGGNLPDLCAGIQAHLSTCASPKVLEVVNKFPPKVPLHEVPRLSTWPSQFYGSGAKEDNIALYFFAKDLESYERNYKSLLDSMIKKDLALKGNLDGVELLIFPSNQLPEKSQRWNMLFFLWGVFRGKRVNCIDSSKKLHIPSLNVVPLDKDIPPAVMTLSENLCSPRRIDEELPTCDRACTMVLTSNVPNQMHVTVSGGCDSNKTSLEQTSSGYQEDLEQQDSRLDSKSISKIGTSTAQVSQAMRRGSSSLVEPSLPDRLGAELKASLQATEKSGSNDGDKAQMLWDTSSDGENKLFLKILPVGNKDVGMLGSVGEDKIQDRMNGVRDQVKLERELKEDAGYMDSGAALLDRDLTNRRIRPYLDLSETAPQTSSDTGQKRPWNEINSVSVDEESAGKRLKSGFSVMSGHSNSRGRNSGNDNFAPQVIDPGSVSCIEEKKCEEACDEKVIREDLGSTERYFFPVDSQRGKDFVFGDNSVPWKKHSSDCEDKLHDDVPNLELALGAEMKPPNKGMLPFFVGTVRKKNDQVKPPDKVKEDDDDDGVSASLSLSLSFPFPDKEQTVKPVSKADQLLPERHNLNNSLLLFGGFRNK
ncbi:ASI1-immunoprecipitated protein 2 isoform X4 [Alnus glutinosa]|uniref:ASI1-immunoprecipitated protein 2 isoform X4 n=1 Tax=Alnus glutinosa TaxID=3517 RepID=UPI002D798E1F|nr:ASI1-immunoprecipitated protein 2 isoform X4 [Alnus glutinosa]